MNDTNWAVMFLYLSPALSKQVSSEMPLIVNNTREHRFKQAAKSQLRIFATESASLWNIFFWLYFKMRHYFGSFI